MKTVSDLLFEYSACNDAIKWARDKSIEQAITECDRGDWVVWLANKLSVDTDKIMFTALDCINTIRHLIHDDRILNCIDAITDYQSGKASKEYVEEAIHAVKDAIPGYSSMNLDSRYAATAIAYNKVDYVPAAISVIIRSSDTPFCDAAAYDARLKSRHDIANICRSHLGKEIIEKVNHILKQDA